MPEPRLTKPMGERKTCYPLRTTGGRIFEPCRIQRKVQLRYSKQPGKSSALHSNSSSAKERPIVGLSERVYESTKLAALFDVLVARVAQPVKYLETST
jgi:hypothetical protein